MNALAHLPTCQHPAPTITESVNVPHLAAVSVLLDKQPDADCFACRWLPLGLYPSKRQARLAVKAYMAANSDCFSYTVLPQRPPGESGFYDKLAARLDAARAD